jgi:hypothetical protein
VLRLLTEARGAQFTLTLVSAMQLHCVWMNELKCTDLQVGGTSSDGDAIESAADDDDELDNVSLYNTKVGELTLYVLNTLCVMLRSRRITTMTKMTTTTRMTSKTTTRRKATIVTTLMTWQPSVNVINRSRNQRHRHHHHHRRRRRMPCRDWRRFAFVANCRLPPVLCVFSFCTIHHPSFLFLSFSFFISFFLLLFE